MSNPNNVLFLGAVRGARKSDGKHFYIISFGVPSSRNNAFGLEPANVFTDENTYNDFIKNGKPGTYYGFDVRYSRGGWDLISYKF